MESYAGRWLESELELWSLLGEDVDPHDQDDPDELRELPRDHPESELRELSHDDPELELDDDELES
jgi:hypothetical protein